MVAMYKLLKLHVSNKTKHKSYSVKTFLRAIKAPWTMGQLPHLISPQCKYICTYKNIQRINIFSRYHENTALTWPCFVMLWLHRCLFDAIVCCTGILLKTLANLRPVSCLPSGDRNHKSRHRMMVMILDGNGNRNSGPVLIKSVGQQCWNRTEHSHDE